MLPCVTSKALARFATILFVIVPEDPFPVKVTVVPLIATALLPLPIFAAPFAVNVPFAVAFPPKVLVPVTDRLLLTVEVPELLPIAIVVAEVPKLRAVAELNKLPVDAVVVIVPPFMAAFPLLLTTNSSEP